MLREIWPIVAAIFICLGCGGSPAGQHGADIDEPLAFEQYGVDATPGAGTDYEVHADRRGSVALVTEPGLGAIAASYEYDAFGNRTAAIEAIQQPYGYTGRGVS